MIPSIMQVYKRNGNVYTDSALDKIQQQIKMVTHLVTKILLKALGTVSKTQACKNPKSYRKETEKDIESFRVQQ